MKLFKKRKDDTPKPSDVMEREDFVLESTEAVTTPIPKRVSRGRVIRHTKRKEFTPYNVPGGRVVRTMPRNLVEIQDAQNGVEDDLPKVEDD